MDFTDVKRNLQRKRAVLFDRSSLCLRELSAALECANRRVAALWALAGAETVAEKLTRMSGGDGRFRDAVALSRAWAAGRVKMPAARRAILYVHAAAKETADPVFAALCHAAGQGCSAVHAKGHAMGLAFYELTAAVRENENGFEEAVGGKIERYFRLLERAEAEEKEPREWAEFLR